MTGRRPGQDRAVQGDGDGWVRCALGHRHWGRYGAAGLLLRWGGDVLLQHRAVWSHHGGTWGIPGGARDSGESAEEAALREAAEEVGVDARRLVVVRLVEVPHGGWSYTTVVADAVGGRPVVAALTGETLEARWVAEEQVERLPLHPGFAQAWPGLRAGLPQTGAGPTG